MTHALTKIQRSILALGLAVIAICFLYVPYEAIAIQEGDNLRANMWFAPLWAPPTAKDCAELFPRYRVIQDECRASPMLSHAIATAFATAMFTMALLLLTTVIPKAKVSNPAQKNGPPKGSTPSQVQPKPDHSESL